MPKFSISVDDETLAWLEAQQKAEGKTRTDIIQAILKACIASENADMADQIPVQGLDQSLAHLDMRKISFTMDAFFQRYLIDNPIDGKSAEERWARFETKRDELLMDEKNA